MNVNSNNIGLIKAIICAGLYPNIINIRIKQKRSGTAVPLFYTPEDGKVSLHKKSVNSSETSFGSQFLVYHLKMKSSSIFVHDTTLVTPFPIIFFGGRLDFVSVDDKTSLGVDGNIRFKCKANIYNLIQVRNQYGPEYFLKNA